MKTNSASWFLKLLELSRSIRFRIALTYSLTIFSLASLVIASIYLILSAQLNDDQFTFQRIIPGRGSASEDLYLARLGEVEDLVNQRALDTLRDYSVISLLVFLVVSIVAGYLISGRSLKPIEKITSVARDIQATDLSRRIQLEGPQDELHRLSTTFNDMLDRLQEAFRANRSFVQDSSHEIKNPLQIIRTNLQLTLSDPSATIEDYQATIEVVTRSIDRISRVIEDLTHFVGYQTVYAGKETLNLSDMVTELGKEFQRSAEDKGIQLLVNPEKAKIKGDKESLKRATVNLLTNAIEILENQNSKDKVIFLTSREVSLNGPEANMAIVEVSDNGPGLAAEDHLRIFARFERGKNQNSQGRGLGLAIARQIVENHGGKIELESELGRGATFRFLFPSGHPPIGNHKIGEN